MQHAGGVKEGQQMTVPFQPIVSELSPLTPGGDNAPLDHWKDGTFDCCKFGCCHPSFLNACCCPQLLLAQVMMRLKMNLFADPAPEDEYKVTFRRMVILVICYWIVASIFAPQSSGFEVNDDGTMTAIPADSPIWQRLIYHTLTTLFSLYFLVILIKVRAAVRRRYAIPEQRCHGMEDCCCAFFCSCCTVAQVARQTADYDERRAVCCSENGLPAMAPAIIV